MGYGFESIPPGNCALKFFQKTFINLDDASTPIADQMVMMTSVAVFIHQLKAGGAIPKVKSLNQLQFRQHSQHPIHRGQVTWRGLKGLANLANGHRPALQPERRQNRLARTGDAAKAMAQPVGQIGERIAPGCLPGVVNHPGHARC